jgi:hypothetical protein
MLSPDAESQFLYSRVPDFSLDLAGKRLAEWYNFNLLDGVPKVNGAIPLHSAHFDLLEKQLYYTSGAVFGTGILDLMSVAWYSAPDNPTLFIPYTNHLPMITAGQKPLFESDARALAAITAKDFDASAVVYLPEWAQPQITASNRTPATVTNIRFSPQRVEADVDSSGAALVVISQTYYHLWRASVDGHSVPLLRANVAFQALEVPPGRHHIKLLYTDNKLLVGALLSALSLAICAWIWKQSGPRDLAALAKGSLRSLSKTVEDDHDRP